MTRQLTRTLSILLLVVALPCLADEADGGLPPALTPTSLLDTFHAGRLMEYSCPTESRCEIRCNGKDSADEFHYTDVRRLEIAPGRAHWLLTAAHDDAVGKAHKSSAMLPSPVSCILDDLTLDRVSHYSDGQLTRPTTGQAVIFDVEPQTKTGK